MSIAPYPYITSTCPLSFFVTVLEARSHKKICLSSDAEIKHNSSTEENTTHVTLAVWLRSVKAREPSAISHNFMRESPPAEAILVSDGEKHASFTAP